MNLADWDKYETLTNKLNTSLPIASNTNKEASNINKIILQSAYKSIPQTKAPKQQYNVPWWNRKLESLKNKKNTAWRTFNRNMSSQNLINFKQINALYRREIRACKKESIQILTSSISPDTKCETIWNKIRTFCGLHKATSIHCIKDYNANHTFTDQGDIANAFSKHWSLHSDDSNFSTLFLQAKNDIFNNWTHDLPHKNAEFMEQNINFIEFSAALNSLKGNTPGYDKINYSMIRHASKPLKNRIIVLFNSILRSNIPQTYKVSTIIPIHKPGKDKTLIESYRPISLNPCISKILDKIISKRLWWFVTTKKLDLGKGNRLQTVYCL